MFIITAMNIGGGSVDFNTLTHLDYWQAVRNSAPAVPLGYFSTLPKLLIIHELWNVAVDHILTKLCM